METPTLIEVREVSPLLASPQGLPDDNGGHSDQALKRRIVAASALVASMTFRLIDPVKASTVDGYPFEDVPDGLVPVALQAIAMLAERQHVLGSVLEATKQATGRRLRSINAGPWGESYFAPGEFARRGTTGRPAMDVNDEIDALLWALATELGREYFLAMAGGVQMPASAPSNLRWDRSMRGY